MITVIVVDDHAVVRQGLAGLIEAAEDMTVLATGTDGEAAVALARQYLPDVVLMDLQMPGTDGVAATLAITEGVPGVQVLVLTSFSDTDRILAALDAGAVGYLLKDAEPEDLLDGVRAVARGESPIHPRAARQLLLARASGSTVELSPRETEVLRLVVAGLANKQIARRLGITERTVKAHLTSVFQRIGASDRTQAALWAQRHGL
jgi:DNA-binding NarL/FixJ family response regulator